MKASYVLPFLCSATVMPGFGGLSGSDAKSLHHVYELRLYHVLPARGRYTGKRCFPYRAVKLRVFFFVGHIKRSWSRTPDRPWVARICEGQERRRFLR
jgi:hypothetical protein